MARLASVLKNNYRLELCKKQKPKRDELKSILKSASASPDQKMEASIKLQSLDRNGSFVRYRNRCVITGRPRAYYRKFKLCRNKFRQLALEGFIPGVTKASW